MMTYASPTVGSEMTRSAFLAVSKSSRRYAVSKINVQIHHLAELLLRCSALPPRPSSQSPRKAYQACPTAKRFMHRLQAISPQHADSQSRVRRPVRYQRILRCLGSLADSEARGWEQRRITRSSAGPQSRAVLDRDTVE